MRKRSRFPGFSRRAALKNRRPFGESIAANSRGKTAMFPPDKRPRQERPIEVVTSIRRTTKEIVYPDAAMRRDSGAQTSSGQGTMVDFTVFIAIASATASATPFSVKG